MIKSKNDLQYYLEADRIIAGRLPSRPGIVAAVITRHDPIGSYLTQLRLCEYFHNTHHPVWMRPIRIIAAQRLKKLGYLLGFSIPINVFGPGLLIPHHGTIVVNMNAKVGAYCVLHTCTCIAGSEQKYLGDGLYLSTGSIISGNTVLGNNITVGANSFVNQSFTESNQLIAGSPAKRIKNRDAWYIADGELYHKRIMNIQTVAHELGVPG